MKAIQLESNLERKSLSTVPSVDLLCNSVRRRIFGWTLRLCSRTVQAADTQWGVQGHLRLRGTGTLPQHEAGGFVCVLKVVSWRLVFCPSSASRRALSVLWRRCGCHWPEWGRLVDGTKKRPQRAGSRILSHKSVTRTEDCYAAVAFWSITISTVSLLQADWMDSTPMILVLFFSFPPPFFVCGQTLGWKPQRKAIKSYIVKKTSEIVDSPF